MIKNKKEQIVLKVMPLRLHQRPRLHQVAQVTHQMAMDNFLIHRQYHLRPHLRRHRPTIIRTQVNKILFYFVGNVGKPHHWIHQPNKS